VERVLYFFLSHAPGEDDSYVQRFFHDLSAAVRTVAGDSAREVGFLDARPAEWGDHNSATVDQALADGRVFVALTSPHYFLSARCGREWTVFAMHLQRFEASTGRRVPAMILVPWGDPATPTVDLGQFAATPWQQGLGLARLVRLQRRRDEYRDRVDALARQIVETALSYEPSPDAPVFQIAGAANAFAGADDGAAPTSAGAPPRPRQRVVLFTAAGTRAEMESVREDVGSYGTSRVDWAPYPTGSLAKQARVLAAGNLFRVDIAGIEGLRQRLEAAPARNEISVVLIDPWLAKLESGRRLLAPLESASAPAAAVLVVRNDGDPETYQQRAELHYALATALPRTVARSDPLFHAEIGSTTAFRDQLLAALEEARNRIFRTGRVVRRPPLQPAGARPILKGP
jgi:FxsC-like protein